ncbi:hypothetical protein GCM10020295_46160 [Streptomyces cinereospinus]
MFLAACGMVMLTRLTVDSAYLTDILPGLLLIGLGMGLTYMPVFATVTAGVAPRDSGVTSATLNTSQQVGGSVGTALLNTVATTSTAGYLTAHLTDPAARAEVTREAVVHGYTVALWCAAGLMLLAALVTSLLVTARAPKHGTAGRAPVAESVG